MLNFFVYKIFMDFIAHKNFYQQIFPDNGYYSY